MSTSFANQPVAVNSFLPTQSALTNGKTLVSDGSTVSWTSGAGMIGNNLGQTTQPAMANLVLPPQSGNNGLFLTTNGSNASWATIPTTVTSTFTAPAFRSTQGIPNSADSSTVGYAFGLDGDTGLFSPIVGGGSPNGVVSLYTNNIEALRATQLNINIPLTVASTSQTTGALTIAGGLGVSGAIHASTASVITNNTQVATTAFVNTRIAAIPAGTDGIGIGQTWQSVVRVSGTTYTSPTRTIVLSLCAPSTTLAGTINITVGGVVIVNTGDYAQTFQFSVIVPPNTTYSYTVTGARYVTNVVELR